MSTKDSFIRDPSRVPERRSRGVNYVVIGESKYGFTELSARSESDAKCLAAVWKKVYVGTAYCFCVQDGEIGGRPFHTLSK